LERRVLEGSGSQHKIALKFLNLIGISFQAQKILHPNTRGFSATHLLKREKATDR